MTKTAATTEQARSQFVSYDRATIEHLFRAAPAPVDADFGYMHGWIILDGQSYCRRECFPNEIEQPYMD